MNIRIILWVRGGEGVEPSPPPAKPTRAQRKQRGAGDHPGEQTVHLWDRGTLSAAGRPGLDYSQARAHEATTQVAWRIGVLSGLLAAPSPSASPSPHHHSPTLNIPLLALFPSPFLTHLSPTARERFHKVNSIMFHTPSKPSSSLSWIYEQNPIPLP